MKGKIFSEVQAALLNSECDPTYAVERALLAVLQFAHLEGEMGYLDLDTLLFKLWDNTDFENPSLGEEGP